MKILIVKTVPGEIRIDKSTYNHQEIGLARAFRKKGHICDVLCSADDEEKVVKVDIGLDDSITLYCIKAVKILKNCIYQNIDSILKEYDVLQLSEYNQIYTWHAAKKYKDKAVVYHGPYYCDFNKRYNAMAKVFDLLFVNRYRRLNTKFLTKSRLAEDYLRKKRLNNVHTIGVGIDIEALTEGQDEKVPFVENILKNISFDKTLLYIGRIEPRRNPMFLLELLKELKSRGEDAGMIIIGTGNDDYVTEFWNRAELFGIKDKIIYIDKLEQKYLCQVYPFADVFVLPTIYDIFGMVLLEAMYFSMLVLTTVNGGSNMLIENGENGYVFGSFDVEKWCDCIQALFADKSRYESIAKAAHKTVAEKFTWDALSGRFMEKYTDRI